MIWRSDIDSDFGPVGGGFRDNTDNGVFVMVGNNAFANFTGLTWCWGGERCFVPGRVFDGAERVALRGGEGDIAGAVGGNPFPGGGVEA